MNTKLQNRLKRLVLNDMQANLKNILEGQEKKSLFLDRNNCDVIYGYRYVDDNLIEEQVKCICLDNSGELCVFMDDSWVEYSENDLISGAYSDDEHWHSLLAGELLGWFTLININEVIHEYL